ncbi:MAG TPA: PAS domain S-box protein [Chloroflexi bacterium]|nr:PAS domain S-box protein [Chloroflexota bacterium]
MSHVLNLLFLEDDVYDAELAISELERAGYTCRWERVEAREGFLAALETPDYDLILADYNLPAFDGLTALALLRERDLDIPFVLVSGVLGEETAIESLKSGATDYVLKDRLSRLGPVVKRALQEKEEQAQRKLAEQALRASEAKYRTLFNHSADPIFILRRDTYQFLDCNLAALALYGYTLDEFRSMTVHQLHPPDELKDLKRNHVDLAAKPTRHDTHVTREGRRLSVETHSAAFEYEGQAAWISIVRDVTSRVKAAEEIRRRNRELTLLNRVISAATSSLDVTHILEVACRELALTLDLPQAAAALLDAKQTQSTVVAEYLEPGRPSALGNRIPVADNPSLTYVLTHKLPLRIANAQEDERLAPIRELMRNRGTVSILIAPVIVRDQVIGTLGLDAVEPRSFSDEEIALAQSVAMATGQAFETARLHQELQHHAEELSKALQKLQELDHLKSEFIQNVSHELRTPLAIARGYAELLDQGELGDLRPEQEKPIAIIARRIVMLSRLVDDINTILELETQELHKEPVDLVELVNDVLTEFKVTAKNHDLTLTGDVQPDLPCIRGDPVHLRRVLDNLLGNAIKFTPAGGRITVCLERDGENALLEVADSGMGIPEDQLERIFNRFYQVDGSLRRRHGGTGLGLALVKEIVAAHGGRVSVTSQVGEGSVFRVCLPFNGAA